MRSGESLAPVSSVQHLHTTNSVQGSLSMPERLQNIPQAAVGFFLVFGKIRILGDILPFKCDFEALLLIVIDCSLRQDPGFFEMVEYFFHKATILAEDNLIDEEMRTMRATREEKVKKAHGSIKYLETNICQTKQNNDCWPTQTTDRL